MQNFRIFYRFFLIYLIWKMRVSTLVNIGAKVDKVKVSILVRIKEFISFLNLSSLAKLYKELF